MRKLDKKKRIEELNKQIGIGNQQIEQIKANINACVGAIKILSEQITEEEKPKEKVKTDDSVKNTKNREK